MNEPGGIPDQNIPVLALLALAATRSFGRGDRYAATGAPSQGSILLQTVTCRDCIPQCSLFSCLQVQFGHAGACANQASETAVAKNQALKEAGVFVPRSFDELGEVIQ